MVQSDAGEIAIQDDRDDDRDSRAGAPRRGRKSKHLPRCVDDDSAAVELSPDEILGLLMTELTVPPTIAGRAFGLGRNAAYDACRPGGVLPAIRIGGKLTVPTAPLRKMLGIEPPSLSAPQTPLPQLAPKQNSPPKRRRGR